jgi:hypothetical protein
MPPPRKPTVIGDRGLPFGAIFETPPPNWPQIVDCAPPRKLLSDHMLPSPSIAMPPSEFSPPPAYTSERVHALGAKLRYGTNGTSRQSAPSGTG